MSDQRQNLVRPLFAFAMVAASTIYAIAQQSPSPTRVRGSIEAVNGDVLAVKSRGGEDFSLRMTPDIRVVGITKIALADIKVGSFIGTTTVPGPDGVQNALEVHVFPENMRGTGEGSRPYDLHPNSSMTNATVAEITASPMKAPAANSLGFTNSSTHAAKSANAVRACENSSSP